MIANLIPLSVDLSQTEFGDTPGLRAFQVLDYSLFMYKLVKGDLVLVGPQAKPRFADLTVYELDQAFRVGIAQVEPKMGFLTRLAGLLLAGKIEFSVSPEESSRLVVLGRITATF